MNPNHLSDFTVLVYLLYYIIYIIYLPKTESHLKPIPVVVELKKTFSGDKGSKQKPLKIIKQRHY